MQDLEVEDTQNPLVGQRNEKLLGLADIHVRHGFIRKVYGILSMQLAVTVVVAFAACEWGKQLAHSSPVMVHTILTLSLVLSVSMMFVFACCPTVMRTSPTNYLFLAMFSLAEGVLVGFICLQYTKESLLMAFIATAVVVIALSLFACQTKHDFTGAGPYFMVGVLVLMSFGFMISMAGWLGIGHEAFQGMRMMYALGGALLFSGYLVYDTQLIVADKHATHRFEVDDYCFAAISLYVDIIQLFLYLLELFGRQDSDL